MGDNKDIFTNNDAVVVSKHELAQELLGPDISVEVGATYFFLNRPNPALQNYFYSAENLITYARGYRDAKNERNDK